jgi:hypothetical protein
MVGPSREVGVISDRHQGILNVVREEIEGYAPLHHRWCTRHLAENLLRKDGVKDNFDLFQEAARQLEDRNFRRKLEEVRTASNAEGRLLTRSIHSVDMILCTRDWLIVYAIPLHAVVAGQARRRTCTCLLHPEVA